LKGVVLASYCSGHDVSALVSCCTALSLSLFRSLSLSLSLSLSRPCECQLACAAPALVVSGPDDPAAGPKRGASRVLFASVSSNPREDATSVPNTGHAQRIPPQARCIDVSTRQVCCSQVRSPHTRAARRRVASQVASASPAPVPASRCRRRAAS